MKKTLILLLILILVLSCFAGCSDINTESATNAIGTVYKVGINQYGEHSSLDNCRLGFIEGLKQAGIVEGKNLVINYQNAGFNDNTAMQIAQSFSGNNVDIMCGIATPAATACFAAAEDKDIPVIFTAISDPVQAKLVEGNITGSSDKLPVAAQLDLIRKIQPDAQKIGIIYTNSEPNSVSTIEEYKKIAPNYGFEIIAASVTAQSEVTIAVDKLIKDKVDCFSNLTDNNVVGVLDSILEKTNAANIPVYGSEIEQVKKGCLASAGIDYFALGVETGKLAAKILYKQATATELDYITVDEYGYYVNMETVNAMKITINNDLLATLTDVTKEQ